MSKRTKQYDILKKISIPQEDDVLFRLRSAEVENKVLKSTCSIESATSLPTNVRQKLVGSSNDVKPTNVPQYSEYLTTDTLEEFILISGEWLLKNVLRQSLAPDLSFMQNRVITSAGYADFVHWAEPLLKTGKIVVPFSFLSTSTPGGIAISDDGINMREVFKSVKANENFWLTAKERGDLALVGSGSGGAFSVGSVYRSQDHGENWTEILSNTDVRVYGIEFSLPTRNAIIVTSGGGVPNNAGKILRSINISVGSPTFTTIATLTEGCRCVKTVENTGTILVGTGVSTGAGIYRSTDEGASFTLIKRFSSTEQNVYWIQDVYDPITKTMKIFVFLSNGKVYLSTDDGQTYNLLSSHYNFTASPVRRVTQFNDVLFAANDIQGLSVFDSIRGKLNPTNNELLINFSTVPFYSVSKYRGGLVGSMGWSLLYSGKVQPCSFNLWSNKSITTGGLDTAPFSKIAHNSSLSSSALIYSDQAGTLTVKILDEAANPVTWRDIGTLAITANTLKTVNFVDYARGAIYWKFNFTPSLTANVDLWCVLD